MTLTEQLQQLINLNQLLLCLKTLRKVELRVLVLLRVKDMLVLELAIAFLIITGFHQLLKEHIISFVHALLNLFEQYFNY